MARALESGGHTVRIIDGNKHAVERLQDFMPRVIAGERPGRVFNMADGIQWSAGRGMGLILVSGGGS